MRISKRIWIFALFLILISVSLFASAEPVYINSDTVLNSTRVEGNQTIGHYVINASNIVVNLNGSTLTRNLTWFDGSTIFSSDGFQNVTIKDGTLNWTDWGKVRPIQVYLDDRVNVSYDIPFAIAPFVIWFVNGLNTSINVTSLYAEGQCATYPNGVDKDVWTGDTTSLIKPGYETRIRVVSLDQSPDPDLHRFQCNPASGNYNFYLNVTYRRNDNGNTESTIGNVSGRFMSNYSYITWYSRETNGTEINDFLLTNSNLNLINVTYSNSKFFWTNFSDSASNLSVGWYLDVQVNATNGNNVSGAIITATDKNIKNYNITTDSNGRAMLSLPEYVENYNTKDFKSNYTVTATYGSLTDTKSVNLTGNTAITLTLNNTAPTVNLISINGSGNNSYTNSQKPNIRFNFTDLEQTTASCEILINGSAGFGLNSSVSVNTNTIIAVNQTLGDGFYNLSVRCYDGISYGYSARWVFTVDTVPPDLNMASSDTFILIDGVNFKNSTGFMSPNSSIGVKDTATIDFRATEKADYSLFIVDDTDNLVKTLRVGTLYESGAMWGNETWNGTNSTESYAPDGLYNVMVNLTDLAGNQNNMLNLGNITIDNTPPAWSNATTNATVNGVTVVYKNNYVNFSANWTDANLYGYIFSINQTGSWVNSSFYNFTGNNVSSYTIQINASGKTLVYWNFYAQDLAGNWNSTEEQNFTVLQTLSIFINPNFWNLGLIPRNTTQVMNSTTRINVTNNGDGNQTYILKISNIAPNDWVPSNFITNNTFVMSGIFVNSSITPGVDFFNNDSSSDDVITTTNKTANSTTFAWAESSIGGYSIPSGISNFLWLRFDSPTSVSSKEQHNITIQIGVIAG